jgi:hypothetical protein
MTRLVESRRVVRDLATCNVSKREEQFRLTLQGLEIGRRLSQMNGGLEVAPRIGRCRLAGMMMIGTTRQGSARFGQQQLLHVHGRIGSVPTKTIDLGSAPSETVLGCQRA